MLWDLAGGVALWVTDPRGSRGGVVIFVWHHPFVFNGTTYGYHPLIYQSFNFTLNYFTMLYQ